MSAVINMLEYLSLGIPGLVVGGIAVILMLLALLRKDAGLMVTAAFFALPVTFTQGTWTGVQLVVRLMPLFSLASAIAIGWDEAVLAWLLPLPTFGYLIYFLFNLVVTNFTRF